MISAYFERDQQAREFSHRKPAPEGVDLLARRRRFCYNKGSGVCRMWRTPTRQEGTADGTLRTRQKDPELLRERQSRDQGNLARILLQGKLGGTGRLLILPVDQGVEHGPARSFAPNPPAYDPHYHYQLVVEAGLSAYAAPLGFIEAGADTFAGRIPTILKLNNANSMSRFKENATQAITANVKDALRLGCSAIGYTIYPGSDAAYDQMRDIAEMACEAKSYGLAVVIWSYPRGGNLSRDGETAIDISAYAAQIAAQLGAHIIKVKPPTAHLELAAAKKVY